MAELVEATEKLKIDPEMATKVRWNRPLIPADFLRMINQDSYSKLYSYKELLYLMDKKGISLDDYETIQIEGRGKPLWRRR